MSGRRKWLKPRAKGLEMAFGVEPSNRKFRLRLARYVGIAELLHSIAAPGFRVLDAGCGRGRVPLYYDARFGATPGRFVGLDLSDMRLGHARQTGRFALLQKASIERLPFRTSSFDAVVCEQVLEHLATPDLLRTVDEFRRVLKPGGHLIVGVPVYHDVELWFKPLWLRGRALLARITGSTPDHEQQFSLRTIRDLVRGSGFEVQEVRAYRLWSFFYQWFEDQVGYYRMHSRLAQALPEFSGEVDLLCRRS